MDNPPTHTITMQTTTPTAEQEIMHQIRLAAKADNPDTPYPYEKIGDELNIDDDIADQFEEFRCSGEPSGIKCPTYSRHYECEERARVLDNGKAVGWTYWHGGGKHGEPEALEWIQDAYFVDVKTEMKPVNTYTKA